MEMEGYLQMYHTCFPRLLPARQQPDRFTNRDKNGKVEFACMGRVKKVS